MKIINIIKIIHGEITEIKSFLVEEEQLETDVLDSVIDEFRSMVLKIEPLLDDDDLEESVDNQVFDNGFGTTINIVNSYT